MCSVPVTLSDGRQSTLGTIHILFHFVRAWSPNEQTNPYGFLRGISHQPIAGLLIMQQMESVRNMAGFWKKIPNHWYFKPFLTGNKAL